jgi:predicted ATP-grasp superfamily ATP-dependent carboligase
MANLSNTVKSFRGAIGQLTEHANNQERRIRGLEKKVKKLEAAKKKQKEPRGRLRRRRKLAGSRRRDG